MLSLCIKTIFVDIAYILPSNTYLYVRYKVKRNVIGCRTVPVPLEDVPYHPAATPCFVKPADTPASEFNGRKQLRVSWRQRRWFDR